MKSLFFIYKNSPFTESRFETLCNLAAIALQKGLEVKVFFDFDGVFNTVVDQQSYESLMLPKDRITELIDSGVSVYICKVCSAARGLKAANLHVENAKFASMDTVSKLIDKADKVLCF